VSEERSTYGTLLDCFVYAPLGAALVFVDEAPRFVERGRERVDKRVAVARLVGKFAVEEARRRLATLPPCRSCEEDRPAPEGRQPAIFTPDDTVPTTRSAAASGLAASVVGRELPIPAYDTLAASQVVERLASLTPAELEAVREHEAGTRRRRTVLHRIAQLSSERDSATA
jgi:hypothetical protein